MSEIERQIAARNKVALDRRQLEDCITRSNYWANIQVHVDRGVAHINAKSSWAAKLSTTPIMVEATPWGYTIRKDVFPNVVYVEVRNGFNEIILNIRRISEPNKDESVRSERLQVVCKDEIPYLTFGSDAYVVPEQAAAHILQPVMDALDT